MTSAQEKDDNSVLSIAEEVTLLQQKVNELTARLDGLEGRNVAIPGCPIPQPAPQTVIQQEGVITKVWDGLMNGDWSVRAPAQPKVAISTITANLDKLQGPEKETAKALLKSLGISI